ncbi:MAG: nucleotidyltransferase family protein [Gammaproteobacteria bacterium]|nr:MAG: nucleotidyltransferase family protein [Gammaproteobacteria bacterium]
MNAMILAAGRGERMRPLTDHVPKPLLPVQGQPLIVHLIKRLRQSGIRHIVINHAHLGEQFLEKLGDGRCYDVHIQFSPEPPSGLETAGGIRHALGFLGKSPFLVINGDIWCDYDFSALISKDPDGLAHLVMVDNPPHHPEGDFGLEEQRINLKTGKRYTYSGIGIFRPELFQPPFMFSNGRVPLRNVLIQAIKENRITGEFYNGVWFDIGTEQRLQQLREYLHGC